MSFDTATRRVIIQLPSLTMPSGGGIVSALLPKTGLLARLWNDEVGTVGGTVGTVHALGFAGVNRRIRLTANSGIDLWSLSGGAYHYMARYFHNDFNDPCAHTNATSVITAIGFDISHIIEMQLNQKDPIGLIMLQNEQTALTLTAEFETTANITSTGTVTATSIVPYMEFFNVPQDPANWPPLNIIHSHIEDQQVNSASSGDYVYPWPRGNTYVGMYHGYGFAATGGADSFTRFRVRVNQSVYLYDVTAAAPTGSLTDRGFLAMEWRMNHPYARPLGVIPIDLLGSTGNGAMPLIGKPRDFINSASLTDLATVITVSAAKTLYTVRRQLVSLG
jgi:hypothetical protein